MGYEIPGHLHGQLAADVDMSVVATYQFTAVTVATAVNIIGHGVGNASIKPIGTGLFYGVLQNPCVQGEAGVVMLNGTTKWQAGGPFAVGDLITPDVNGRATKALTGTKICGIALEQAVSGDTATVLIRVNGTAP